MIQFLVLASRSKTPEKISQVWENLLYSCHFGHNDQLGCFLIKHRDQQHLLTTEKKWKVILLALEENSTHVYTYMYIS